MKVVDRRNQALGGQKNQRSLSSVTDIGVHWSGVANGTIEGHERHWKDTLGWRTGGYHFSIKRDGIILWNYNLERITNGVGGHNSTSVHVMYEGGKGAPMNEVQKKSLKYVINTLMKPKLPNLKRVRGHNEFPNTSKYNHSSNTCPGINMNDFRAYLKDDKVNVSKPAEKPVQVENKRSIDDLARQVIAGRYGSGDARKKALGSQYDAVQKRVNEMLGAKPKPKTPQIKVDGYLGTETIKALQRYFGTPQDGIISKPSMVVKALQGKVGARVDGYWGAETTRRLQRYLGTPQDGVLSRPSMVIKELQRRLNNNTF